jgi:hypothetical protein
MGTIVAYNNDCHSDLHRFFETCAERIIQCCSDLKIPYEPVSPPNLTEEVLFGHIPNHEVCFIAAHGMSDAIVNEKDENVISTRSAIYSLEGKVFYAISCHVGQTLKDELMRIGTRVFVGYSDDLRVTYELEDMISEVAVSGLVSLLNGNTPETAKAKMVEEYDKRINETSDILKKAILMHDKEYLCFEFA